MGFAFRFRGIATADWPMLERLEFDAYAAHGLSEGVAALRSRARVHPDVCFAIEADHAAVGYAIALPYPFLRAPDLKQPDDGGASPSDNLHLHDIVVAEDLRGRGVLRAFLPHLTTTARALGFGRISMVSVLGNEARWARFGFIAHPGVPVDEEYGPQAVYMSQRVDAIALKRIGGGRRSDDVSAG